MKHRGSLQIDELQKGDEGFTFVEVIVGMLVVVALFGGAISLILTSERVVERGMAGYTATAEVAAWLLDLRGELEAVDYNWWESPPEWSGEGDGFSLRWNEGGEPGSLKVDRLDETISIDSAAGGRREYFVSNLSIRFSPHYLAGGDVDGIVLDIGDHTILLATGSRPVLSEVTVTR